MRRAKAEEKMYVVVGAANRLGDPVQVSNDPAQIGMQISAPVGVNERFTVFGAENDVKMKAHMC